ncbi:MAG: hypothetical protein IPJ81_04945 [Chitinophagaceae bacterium]|nr:hypothetical protein [Chitinophagaceae bacterium]
MLYKTLFLALSVATLGSCSTAYKSTQTPDDVYYSPSRPLINSERAERNNDTYRDEVAVTYFEDRQIMMGIRDRRWRAINDPFAFNNGYFGNSYYGNSFYNNYNPYNYSYYNSPYNYTFNSWNNNFGYYYNPYYYPYPIYNPVITKFQPNIISGPRMTNLNAYSGYNKNNIPRTYNNTNNNTSTRTYNNTNTNRSRVENVLRKVLTPSSGRANNDDNNTRSYSPSNSGGSNRSSSPSSSGSSGGGGVSRPSRGR